MVRCQVTRHLNGTVKCFIVQEEDDTLIINMDKVSIIAFEVMTDNDETYYSMIVHKENSSVVFYLKSFSNFKEVKDFITTELTRA